LYKFGSNPELRTKNPQQAAAIHLAGTAYTMPAWTYLHIQYPSIYPDDAKNVTAAEELGLKPSHYAIAKQFMVSIIVKGYKTNLNALDYHGLTALSHTIDQGDLALASMLIEELGVVINIPDFRGVSCL
jgi:ankyrin repeat protein